MMDTSLKEIVIPILREHGFKGSIPHFRRVNETNIELITFQFNKWGGSFVVELATCPKEGITISWGEKIPPNKVTAHHINERFRLGATSLEDEGIWFSYEKARTDEEYAAVAKNVLKLLNTSDGSWITTLF
jgi:agmatine/peptidylarginine deiminase